MSSFYHPNESFSFPLKLKVLPAVKDCQGCIGEKSKDVCRMLPICQNTDRIDNIDVIFIFEADE